MTREYSEPVIIPIDIFSGFMDPKRSIKVIIPVYNEENTIKDLIKRILNTFSKLNKRVEIICVDDGSVDNTREILDRSNITLIRNGHNLGKGEALKKGFNYCSPYDIIITLDADGEHCPEDISKLLEPLFKGEADIIIGSRFLKTEEGYRSYLNNRRNLAYLRMVGNQIFSIITKMVTQKLFTDTQSGFRVYKPNVINNLNLKSSGFEIETETIIEAIAKGYKIKEVPIDNGYAQRDSYMNIVIDSIKIGLTFLNGVVPRRLRYISDFLIRKINKIR